MPEPPAITADTPDQDRWARCRGLYARFSSMLAISAKQDPIPVGLVRGMVMARIAGGCLCGAVRYTCDADPAMTVVCHCTHCQKTSGSAFSVNVGVPANSVTLSGTAPGRFEDVGASGKPVWRSFCQTCGCSLSTEAAAFPGVVFLKAGTLDDRSWLAPKLHIWTKSMQPWVTISADAEQVEQNPE